LGCRLDCRHGYPGHASGRLPSPTRRSKKNESSPADRGNASRRRPLRYACQRAREAIRSDYREILRFIERTRLFVLEMRARLAGLEDYSAHASSDAREVEDLEARAEILRRRFLDELPDVQSLIGAWAPETLITLFDQIDDFRPKIAAHMSVALHVKLDGKRFAEGIDDLLGELDQLVTLLNRARDLLQAEQRPD
jgi:hypothetical protein